MIVPAASRRLVLLLAASACLMGSARAAGVHGHAPAMHMRGPAMAGEPLQNAGRFPAARTERLQGIRTAQRQQRAAPPPPQPAPPVQPQPAATPEPVDPARSARPGRLTPDERRTLRQQINEAGRDVYRPNRP